MEKPLRLYQGPKQEKQYRKKQRQLLLQEQQNVYKDSSSVDSQETKALVHLYDNQKENKDKEVVEATKPEKLPDSAIPGRSVSSPPSRPSRSNYVLIFLACLLFLITLGTNVSVAWDKGTALLDKGIMASLGAVFEAILFFLPNHASSLWTQHRFISSIIASVLFVFLFVFALLASLGFASLNLSETATVRAERITPAVADAQRKLDTISASRASECLKRGPLCRGLEEREQEASKALTEARQKVSEAADPQIAAAAKLVAWVTLDRFHPTADDFAMLRLLLLTLLPQLGGLVLMVANRP